MKLKPKCLPDPDNKDFQPMPLAIDNRGHLIPCCWCDHPKTTKAELYKPLYKVSKLEDYNSIDEILDTKEWKEFEDDLVQARDVGDNLNRINQTCLFHCKARDKEDNIKVETYYEKGKEVAKDIK
tara:strand:+ start:46 stop:420 length:375 start_codon:yes stop_codon:yes gene_type:complete